MYKADTPSGTRIKNNWSFASAPCVYLQNMNRDSCMFTFEVLLVLYVRNMNVCVCRGVHASVCVGKVGSSQTYVPSTKVCDIMYQKNIILIIYIVNINSVE